MMPVQQSLILSNGAVRTMDPARPLARVLAMAGDTLVYVGDDLDEAKRRAPGAVHMDLGGRCAVPGLIDAHLHFLHLGQIRAEMDIYWKPKAGILRLVAEEAARRAPGEWITGRGWNHDAWPDHAWPDRAELDAVAPHNPVALSRADAHSMWVNSLALEKAGLDENCTDPPGGEYIRRADGSLAGILVDTAIASLRQALPPMSDEAARRFALLAQETCLALGLTSVGNASQSVHGHDLLAAACQDGSLRLRIYDALATHGGEDLAWTAAGRQPEFGAYGERLSARAVKIVSDGSLGSRSAWLLREYADRPGHRGNGRYSDEELYALVLRGHTHGFQVWLHAIGDAAVHQAVTVYARVLAEHPRPDHRCRIEHFQIAEPEDIKKAMALGLIPAMQTVHLASDLAMAGQRLDERAQANAYPWQEVTAAGGVIANGSDAPMDSVNPFHGIHAGVTRKDAQGNPPAGWGSGGGPGGPGGAKGRTLSRIDALKSYTVWPAYAEFAEQRKGMLRPGMLADIAVLSNDILTCPEEDIRTTRCLLTVLGGQVVQDSLM